MAALEHASGGRGAKMSSVSVLMVAHNAEDTIGQALSSLLLQSHQDWTCYIVNDASDDATRGLLSRLTDPRFSVLHSEKRLGRGKARNLALRQADGKYVSSLDSDDFLFPLALESQVRVLDEDPVLSACTGSLFLFDLEQKPLGRRRTQISPGRHKLSSPLTTGIPLGSTMIRRSLIGAHRFSDTLGRSEDRDFFERLLCGTVLTVLSEPTYAYRWNLSLDKVMEGLANREALFLRSVAADPVRVGAQFVWNRWKRLCYPAIDRWGLWGELNRWRVKPATSQEAALFEKTLSALSQAEVFG